jgi:hypothetical protein
METKENGETVWKFASYFQAVNKRGALSPSVLLDKELLQ